jgi:RND family efflux transporter MFP subunit
MPDLKDDLAALRIEREPETGRSGQWVRWVILLVLVAGGSGAAWKYFTRERPVVVEAATVSERAAGTQAAVLNASGYVTARRRATVSSKITGKVVEVNVDEGMAVTEGQVLARLDDVTARASVAMADAQVQASRAALDENRVRLAESTLNLKRMTELLKGGIVGQAEVDTAQAQVDSIAARIKALDQQVRVAESQADFARTNLADTVIRAPFSGIAISKDAQPGEMVSPVSAGGGFTRTGICTVVDMHSLEIEVDVNESYINRVKPAQAVTAMLDAYPDWQIPAEVITMVPTADRQKATVLVRIRFKKLDPRILPDMGVKVTFLREPGEAAAPVAQQPVALAPKNAIRADGTQSIAFVIGPTGIVERRAVRTGGVDGDRLEGIAGLRAGDRVVLSPPATLAAGTRVVVK